MRFSTLNVSSQLASSFFVGAVSGLLVLSVAEAASVYGDHPESDAATDSTLVRAVERVSGSPLRLEDALRRAVASSPNLQEAEAELRAAVGRLRSEHGLFDPELFGDISRGEIDTPATSPFAGADVVEEQETKGSFGTRVTLPTGTEIEASMSATRLVSNSAFSSWNPQTDANGLISLRQPLLRGFGSPTRVELRAAQRGFEAAAARREDARLALFETIESLYWDVYAAERDYAVLELIREQAETLLDEVRVRHEAGLVGSNEVENARAFLAQQELAALDGEESLDRNCDDLRAAIGEGSREVSGRIHPTDTPPRVVSVPQIDRLVNSAIETNFSLRAARADVEAARARAKAARWTALPELDARGTLGGSGLSGTGRDVSFEGITFANDVDGGVTDAWSQVFGGDFPSWSIGLELRLPLGLRSGRGERDRLRAEFEREAQSLRRQELTLERNLRDAHRTISHGEQRLEIASRGVNASSQQLRIGLIEYRNGRSTAFEIVRLGADLADAQRRYSDALVRTAKAVATLRRLSSDQLPSFSN